MVRCWVLLFFHTSWSDIKPLRDCGSDEKILLFVKINPAHLLTESLKKEIKMEIRSEMSPRHVPDDIIAVPDIPVSPCTK